jgi:pilus assembly protein CpaF
MGLTDRLQYQVPRATVEPSLIEGGGSPRRLAPTGAQNLLESLKGRVQDRLFERIGPRKIDEVGPSSLLAQITDAIREIITEEGLLLTDSDQAALIEMTTNEMLGLGPLEPLLQDNDVSDILVNGYGETYVERKGKLAKTNVRFHDDQRHRHRQNHLP